MTASSAYVGPRLWVLYVEDNPDDAELCLKQLEHAGLKVKADVVDTREQFMEKLRSKAYDIVLADYQLPGWSGTDALEILRQHTEDMPFLLVTGTMGEEVAVECMKKGVTDYILKDRPERLAVAVRRALEEKKVRNEQKRAEKALRESEEQLRAILDNSTAVIYLKDRSGRYIKINRQFENLFRVDQKQFVGKTDYDLFPRNEEMAEKLRANDRRVLEARTSIEFEEVVLQDDGLHTYISIKFPIADSSGTAYAVAGISTDISQRKHAEETIKRMNEDLERRVAERTEALSASAERFRAVTDTANDAIISANSEGNIIQWNQGAERTFGYTAAEALGKPLTLLMPQRFHAPHRQGIQRYLSTGEAHVIGRTVELTGRRKDRTEFPLDLSLASWNTGEGTFFTGIIRDITERKHLEQTLRDKNTQLEDANLAKDRFLANMSHELRTPLNAIIGFTGTLLMKLAGPLTDEQSKQLRTIQSSSNHLLSLINDLLDLAQIGSGKRALNIEPVILQTVVEEVCSTLHPLAEKKGLELKITLPQDSLVLNTDRRALHQILLNITSNAIKFTDRGEVRVVVGSEAHDGKSWMQLSVNDSGIGIRPEDQPKIFRPFSQVEGNVRRQEGTGLGLHLSQKLAEVLGGQINFKSEYGKGSTFTLSLPERLGAG